MLLEELSNLSVECLPDEIPSSVPVKLDILTERDQAVRVEDITLDEGVVILNDPGLVVVKIGSRPKERIEEPVVEEAEEAAEAQPEAPESEEAVAEEE